MNIKQILVAGANLPVVGGLIAYTYLIPAYIILMVFRPIIFWLAGLRRIKFGTLTVWIPLEKKTALTEALELLRSCDQDLFSALTKKRHLMIHYAWNIKKTSVNSFGYIFGIRETYFKWGTEGLVLFLVQSLLTSESYPDFNQLKCRHGRDLQQKVLDWVILHSFQPSLIDSFRKVVEKWEQEH